MMNNTNLDTLATDAWQARDTLSHLYALFGNYARGLEDQGGHYELVYNLQATRGALTQAYFALEDVQNALRKEGTV